MGLDNSLFGYANFQKVLEQVDAFLNEHLPGKFISNFPKLIHLTKWKFDYIAVKKMAKKYNNNFISNNLKWYERDGLDT